ncbi:MAG: NAD(P)H-dependent oxidoreductase [Rhodobacteraceae bacterium]|nr:NAD(P)H-dependent oxidoreductase [Paracoccaceae bacterium]
MPQPKIVVFAGSSRRDSFNKKLAALAAQELEALGAEVIPIDLKDYQAPVYDGDTEEQQGIPPSMTRLEALIAGADAVVIASPEYNGFVPPLLVNVFSWVSRGKAGAFAGKNVAIMATSPGGFGGVRMIPRLRDALAELGSRVVPGFVTIPSAMGAFNPDGSFVHEAHKKAVAAHMSKLLALLR